MDFKKLVSHYKQFGGFRLIIEYAKLGVLGTIMKGFFKCLIKRRSFKGIYPEVLRKIEPYLVKRYSPLAQEFKNRSRVQNQELGNSRINATNTDCTNDTDNASTDSATKGLIWFCWLQGIDNAPEIVQACYNSLERLSYTDIG